MTSVNKKSRSNKAQVMYLLEYMASHPTFAAGDFKTPLGAANHEEEWRALKQDLDELGPHRSVEQWKICWRDQKRKARIEGGAHSKAVLTTGNYAPIPELSESAVLVLSTIGAEMAVGCGPQESPIGIQPQQTAIEIEIDGESSANLSSAPYAWPIAGPSTCTAPPSIPAPPSLPHPSAPSLPGPSAPSLPGPSARSLPGPSARSLPGPCTPSLPGPSAPSLPGPSARSLPGPSTPSLPGPSAHSLPGPSARSLPGSSAPTLPGPPAPARRTRARKSHPPDRFLNAQLELNGLMKEILQEIKISNQLRREKNMILKRQRRH